MLNWRRKPNHDYPHFDAMFGSFTKLFELFRAFLTNECGTRIDTITRLEINYINIIPPNILWETPQDFSRVFPKLSMPEIVDFKDGPTAINLNYRYQLSPDDALSINIANGKQAQANKEVFLLDIKIQGTPSDKQLDRMEDWFKIAHQHTRTAFLAYTNPKMRSEVWKEFGDL